MQSDSYNQSTYITYRFTYLKHVRISLGTEFQLKHTISIFWTKFA